MILRSHGVDGILFFPVNPVTNRIYVGGKNDAFITVIDGADNQFLIEFSAGILPRALDLNPSTNRIYVLNSGAVQSTSNFRRHFGN